MDIDRLFRETMTVDLTNMLGEDSILVMGPGTSTSIAKFPLRQYAVQDRHPSVTCSRPAGAPARFLVVEYVFPPAETTRCEPGQAVHYPCADANDAYRIAYGIAQGFAEQHAAALGIRVRDALTRRPCATPDFHHL